MQDFWKIFLFWVFAASSSVGSTEKCGEIRKKLTANQKSMEVDYALNILEELSRQTYATSDDRFILSICDKLSGSKLSNAAAGLMENVTNPVTIGLYNEITVQALSGSARTVSFWYKKGDKCISNATREARIVAVCDVGMEKPALEFLGGDNCSYSFLLATKTICDVKQPTEPPTTVAAALVSTTPLAPASEKQSRMSGFGVFVVLLLALAIGYCVVGFLYKRYVLGARGAQQLPNYLFWIRVCNTVQDCVANRSSTYSGSSSRTTEYDRPNAADVHLMHDDDSKYDQPPLTVGPGSGQTSTFRQQPLSVAPASNTPTVNAQRQHREPLLLPNDEADERLLQV